ncbi:MAG: site-specific integrase [Colwellia sp.]
MEIIWSSKELVKNLVVKEFLTCLSDKESISFIEALEALFLTSELTNICQILLRLEDILLAVKGIDWPAEINTEINDLVSALSKIKSQEYFRDRLKNEIRSIKNPIYGRIEEYPIAALFCQQFGTNIEENQKPLIFLLNFILFQIARHNHWDKHKKSNLLAHAANTLRKVIACDIKFEVHISPNKLNFNNLNKLLIALTSANHIDFQEQFLRAWAQFYQDQPFVRKKHLKKEKRQCDQSLSKKTLNIQPTNATEMANGTVISSGFLSTLTDNTAHNGIDDAFVDIVEVTTPNNVELDHRTKAAASIYGSRLSLIEKKHLPWRSNVLAKHEVDDLVAFINSSLLGSNDPISIFICLLLLTSKPYVDLLQVKVFTEAPLLTDINSDFIELSSSTWWRRSVEMPNAYTPSLEQRHLLAKHSDWLILPLPNELILAIKKLKIDIPLTIEKLCFKDRAATVEGELSRFLQPLWKDNPHLHRRITPAAVRAVLFERITEQFDSGYASLMLANTEFDTPTTLYYISERSIKLEADYIDVVNNMGIQLTEQKAKSDTAIGSRLAINKAKIKEVLAAKKIAVLDLISQPEPSLEQIIIRHNQFVNYTLLVLVAASGHRSRTEFGFSSYSTDEENHLLLIADKINFVDSSIRFLPHSLTVQKQMLAYKNHCADISRLIKTHNLALATVLSKAATLQINNKPTFFHIIGNDIKAVGSHQLTAFLQPDINLPLNFLRHHFCSALRSVGEYQYAKAMMGHIGGGEHLLSDHACSSLNNIIKVAGNIDVALESIGIEAINFTPPKGPKLNVRADVIEQPYRPNYLKRNEITERKDQIRWVRKLISPHLKALLDPKKHEEKVDELLKRAIADNESAIPVERRLFWLNRIIAKISQSRRWVSILNEPEILSVGPELLLNMRQTQLIKSKINEWLLANKHPLTYTEKVAKLWCSLVINSTLDSPINLLNIATIKAPPFYEHSLAWFEMTTRDTSEVQRVYIDSISLLLIQRYSFAEIEIKSAVEVKKCIYQGVLRSIAIKNQFDSQAQKALKSIDSVGEYLRGSRDVSGMSLLHAYCNNRVLTTDLSSEKLCRWLSPNPVVFEQTPTESSLLIPFSTSVLYNTTDSNYKSSLILVRKLHRKLRQLKNINTHKIPTSKAIIQTWADFINLPNESNVEHLIQHSNQLSVMIILIILWLIDVAKRPGRGRRKCTAIGTVKTYLSNVAKPLLEQSIHRSILTMDPEEITELYCDALDARNITDRAQRAENMRNFHNFVMGTYQCSPVDWYNIEPSINNNERAADANIISMREYNEALSLLKNDQYMTENEQDINQIILILCYRAGLRSGEATHLKIHDIDSTHWIIHVRTTGSHRTKTLKSNRRVPVGLLLSDEEKKLIIKRIELAKQYHPNEDNLWLFCDITFPSCLVYLDKHTCRINEAIKMASGDNSLRIHHARHSFANYLLLLMSKLFYSAKIYSELKTWIRKESINAFSQLMIATLTGKKASKENILHAISLAMGHASPETTLRSYIHILGLMNAVENEQCLRRNIDIPSMASLSGVKKNNAYKILNRGGSELYGFTPLCEHVAKGWGGYQQLSSCLNQNHLPLSLAPLNKKNELHIEFNAIERIIRSAERECLITKIAQRLQLDVLFVQSVVKATQYIKFETGYMGTSISSDLEYIIFASHKNKEITSAKYIRQAEFQTLLADIAELTNEQQIELSTIWKQNYNHTHGLVMDPVSIVNFKLLLTFIDYQVIELDNDISITGKYGKRKGKIVKFISKKRNNKKNNDNKLHHAIFLLSVWLKAKEEIVIHERVVHEH